MICNQLSVGTELLLGQIDDTNSSYIGRQLLDAGLGSYEHRRVGDNPQRLENAMREMLETTDCLIVTGGLGPTHDDITREITAKIMGVGLNLDQDVLANMKKMFEKRKRPMPKNNERQAMVPNGAIVISNTVGTAPGLMCPVQDKWIYLLPGVPHEMKLMLNGFVIPHIKKRSDENAIVMRTIKTWGISESELAQTLDDLVQDGEKGAVKVGFLARGINGLYVKLSASALTKTQARKLIYPVEEIVLERLGDAVYAFDDETMEEVVVKLLQERSLTLAIAESLTGGMLTSRLVEVQGVSSTLLGGIVSYDPKVKNSVLGVETKDVYSKECAMQMAQGVRRNFESSIGLSTTGVAGPKAEQGHEPGEVFIGIASETVNIAQEFHLGGDRMRVRQYCTITALNYLRLYLLDKL